MENNFTGISCAFYTVKQLAALFGKSEDTIRRWKNEGIGREDDNIKLQAIEREDPSGRKNTRHLVFSREAVIDFVRANPFLMDDAPQLNMMMQAENAWREGGIPLPGALGSSGYREEDEDEPGWPREAEDDEEYPRKTGFWAEVARLKKRFEEAMDDDVTDSEGEGTVVAAGERVPNYPVFERRPHGQSRRPERVKPQGCGTDRRDPFDVREELEDEECIEDFDFARPGYESRDRFDSQPFDSGFDDMDNPGWRRRIPRGGPGRRQAADEEFRRREKVIYFALETLRNKCEEMTKSREKMSREIKEVQTSGMDGSTINSIIDMMHQKIDELGAQTEMLEEFISVIEAEIADS